MSTTHIAEEKSVKSVSKAKRVSKALALQPPLPGTVQNSKEQDKTQLGIEGSNLSGTQVQELAPLKESETSLRDLAKAAWVAAAEAIVGWHAVAVQARKLDLEPKRLTLVLKHAGWSDSAASQLKAVVTLPAVEWKRFEVKNLTFRAALLVAREAKKTTSKKKGARLRRTLESVLGLLESSGREEFSETIDGYEVVIRKVGKH